MSTSTELHRESEAGSFCVLLFGLNLPILLSHLPSAGFRDDVWLLVIFINVQCKKNLWFPR